MASLTYFTTLERELDLSRHKWETEYPGETATLELLRESLIAAECAVLHSRSALHGFIKATESTSLPMYLWDCKLFQSFNRLKRQHAQDSRHCTRALQAVAVAHATQVKAVPAPLTPPPPSKPAAKPVLEQLVEIELVDGQIVTSINSDAAYWCKKAGWNDIAYYVRRFWFHNSFIPDYYRWALTHDGITNEPAEQVALYYMPEEFKRICELELSTGSTHLLDGHRKDYKISDD